MKTIEEISNSEFDQLSEVSLSDKKSRIVKLLKDSKRCLSKKQMMKELDEDYIFNEILELSRKDVLERKKQGRKYIYRYKFKKVVKRKKK